MEWLEADPLPKECQACSEDECYNCDYAGKRWYLSAADEMRIRRKGLIKAMERIQRQIKEIDSQLALLGEQKSK